MAHPLLVITVGEVLASVSSTRLLPCLGRDDGLVGAGEEVAKLEGLDKVAVSEEKGQPSREEERAREAAHEFQIMERSLIPTSFHVPSTRLSSLTPCSSDSWVLNTAASF